MDALQSTTALSDITCGRGLPFSGLLLKHPLAIAVIDRERRLVFVNGAFERLFGFREADAIGRRIDDLTGGAATAGEIDQLQRQALAEQAPHIVTRRRRQDGSSIDVEIHVGSFDIDGVPGATFAIYRDLTAETRARHELSRFFMLSLDLLCIAGFDGYFKQVNPSFQRVLGHPESALLATPFIDFVHPDDREATLAEYARVECGEVIVGFQNRYRCADGSYRWLEWASMPTTETRTVYAAARDVTIQHLAEQRLREAMQMKADFVSFVTHQLRTPLAGIKWMLELSAEAADRDESNSYVQDARESADRLIALVNDLLDASRLENGRIDVHPEPVDLRELTESVLGDVATLVADKGHDLSIDVRPGTPAVVADPQLLRQVVMNLISNAVKYTPAGGRLRVRLFERDRALRWEIEDNGIGIPESSRARLFEKFFRAENATSVDTEGTGLGLYLVKLIVERCGGTLGCESTVGKGSTFHFEIPVAPIAPETTV